MHKRIVTTALIALAVTSCQKKASGQTVAVVNNEEITAAELNAEINSENNASADPKQARIAALQNLINRKLLVQQAKGDGIDKTPDYLNRLRRTTDDLMISMLVARRVNTSQVPSPDQINGYEGAHPQIFANREIWSLSQISYPLPKDPAIVAKIAAAKSLDEVAQTLTANNIQFKRGTRKLDTAVLPNNIYAQLAHLPPNEPIIAPGQGQAVASVITAREPAPIPDDQKGPAAANLIRRDQVNQALADRVKAARASAKIEYQPGFAPPAK